MLTLFVYIRLPPSIFRHSDNFHLASGHNIQYSLIALATCQSRVLAIVPLAVP